MVAAAHVLMVAAAHVLMVAAAHVLMVAAAPVSMAAANSMAVADSALSNEPHIISVPAAANSNAAISASGASIKTGPV